MFPIQAQAVQYAVRSGHGHSTAHSRPPVADGRDLPDQRLAHNNSRAMIPEHLFAGADAKIPVDPGLAQLLQLGGDVVNLNRDNIPLFSVPPVRKRAAPEAINFNIPPSGWRYVDQPVVKLLEEVVQRAVGEGPDDAAPVQNPGVRPEGRRLGDMIFALANTPGREHDALVLRNAGLALNSFLYDYRTLVEEMREKRPDLAPVTAQWRDEIARAAILRAIAVPLGADGEPQYDPRLYDPIVMPVRQPFDSYLPDLEWRLGELQRETFAAQSRQYFSSLSVPIVREAARENRVLGVASNELEGPDVRGFLAGTVVFRCAEAELVGHLQMVPAGHLKRSSTMRPHISVSVEATDPPYTVTYPRRGSGTTIRHLQWQDAAGVTKPVLVANWKGVHSFSLDVGRTWRATGAPASAALNSLRADGWRQLMADRWHAHREAALANSPPIGGR